MFTRKAAIASFLFLAVGASVAIGFSTGPPAGRTGAPAVGGRAAEGLCTNCHTTFAPNLPGAQLNLLDVPDAYVPDSLYTIRVRMSSTFTAPRRWGFQMTAVAEATGDSAGHFASLSTNTQVISGGATFPTRHYIQHTSAGTFAGDLGPVEWTVNWKAPSTNVGRVLFFCAGNAANNNNFNTNDHIYTTRDTSEFDNTVGAPLTPLAGVSLAAGPNPARGPVAITFGLPGRSPVRVGVYDASGRLVRALEDGVRDAGRHSLRWDGHTAHAGAAPAGVYFVRLEVAGGGLTRKVVLAH